MPSSHQVDIALFGSFEEAGGASRTLANQIKCWVRWGLSVEVVAYRGGTKPYGHELPVTVSIVSLGTRSKLTSAIALWRYMRAKRPTVILATTHLANLVLAYSCLLPGVQTQRWLSVHNNYVRSERKSSLKGRAKKFRQIRRHYPRAAGIITVSKGVRDDLVKEFALPQGKVHVAYNAVLDENVLAKANEAVDHSWLIKKNRPIIVAVGRLAHQKDYPTLLHAFALLRKTHDCGLLIMGEGPERLRLEALVQELGLSEHVSMPGFVANPYAAMARCDLFVLSSIWEGFGNVVAEALGLGLPVVSTDCPSGPAEILGYGAYGKLVPVRDPDALAAAMRAVLDGDVPEFDRAEAVHAFTSPVSARRYLELFGLTAKAGGTACEE